MSSPKVRADHEVLAALAQRFETESNDTRQTLHQLQSRMEVLQGGDWIGKGAQAFYREMNGDVLPALKRLGNALEAAQRALKAISQLMREAEDEASNMLRQETGSGGEGELSGGASDGSGASMPTGGGGGGGGSRSGGGGGGGSFTGSGPSQKNEDAPIFGEGNKP